MRHTIFGFSWLSLVACLAGCAPDTVLTEDTAGSTTSPSGDGNVETESGVSESSEGESESESESEGESESDGPDTGLIPNFDDGLWGDECDPFAQDCAEGDKCVPFGSTGGNWDANKCVPILGDDQPGEACTYGGSVEATDSCDGSSYCWDVHEVDGQLVGFCRAFCQGTADAPSCAEGTSCLIANEGSINLCIPTCDPVAPECAEGLTCAWLNDGYKCTYVNGSETGLGEPCDDIGQCGPGLICLMADALPECAALDCCGQWCSLSAPVCDWEGTECVAYFDEDPPEGYEDLGICVVPEP